MFLRSTFLVVALLATATIVPVGGATRYVPDEVCRYLASDAANVFTAPAGEVPNWQPDCVEITSGGTVTWTMGADLGHAPVSEGCFKRFDLVNAGQKTATFTYVPSQDAIKVVAPLGKSATATQTAICKVSDGKTQQRESKIPFGDAGPMEPVMEDLGDAVVIWYKCAIHGSTMSARVIVQKTA